MNDDFAEPLQQMDRVFVQTARGKLLYFGGCDYFRLSSHPRIVEALHGGLDRYGLTTSASRKTTGNHVLYQELERASAEFFGAERAVVVSSGYLSNLAAGQGLRGELDQVFVDERCHGSLRDAIALLGCPATAFRHKDPDDLASKIAGTSPSSRLAVVTDSVFSFDGSMAPLAAYRERLGPDGLLWVDDAHGAGVLGRTSLERARVSWKNVVLTMTFSKAFGVYGGAVLCDERRRDMLVARSSAITGNTPLPLPLAAGCLAALQTLDPAMQGRLRDNIEAFWRELAHPTPPASPIASFTTDHPNALKERLLDAGIYPSLIKYPGGPEKGYFRFALSSEHTSEQIRRLASTLRATDGLSSLVCL